MHNLFSRVHDQLHKRLPIDCRIVTFRVSANFAFVIPHLKFQTLIPKDSNTYIPNLFFEIFFEDF
jgi:hypothetical protein